MVAAALLLIGWLQWRYGSQDLQNVAELIVALAALIVAAPIFWEALSASARATKSRPRTNSWRWRSWPP